MAMRGPATDAEGDANSTLNAALCRFQQPLPNWPQFSYEYFKAAVRPSDSMTICGSSLTYLAGLHVLFCTHCQRLVEREGAFDHLSDMSHLRVVSRRRPRASQLESFRSHFDAVVKPQLDRLTLERAPLWVPPNTFFYPQLPLSFDAYKCRLCCFIGRYREVVLDHIHSKHRHPHRPPRRARRSRPHDETEAVIEMVPRQHMKLDDADRPQLWFIPKMPFTTLGQEPPARSQCGSRDRRLRKRRKALA